MLALYASADAMLVKVKDVKQRIAASDKGGVIERGRVRLQDAVTKVSS